VKLKSFKGVMLEIIFRILLFFFMEVATCTLRIFYAVHHNYSKGIFLLFNYIYYNTI